MRLLAFVFAVSALFFSCGSVENKSECGEIVFHLPDSGYVSLKIRVSSTWDEIVVFNGDDRVVLREAGEGVYSVPVFGGSIRGQWGGGGLFKGFWVDSLRYSNYRIPLEIRPAVAGASCMEKRTSFKYNTNLGLLVGECFCDSVVGTILTPTGDYRYLTGVKSNKDLRLNTFDGAHLFSFTATIESDSLLNGVFLSGKHYTEEWEGVRVDSNEPPWPSSQKSSPDQGLSFLGISPIKLLDSLNKKLLVVDVLGTWCPNCYDEVRLIKSLKERYEDVLFLSVAFERGDSVSALKRIEWFKKEVGVSWDVLYGGVASKKQAETILPFLGGVKSFPTTAFISLDGEVVVHTGFNGPATPLYQKEVVFYENTINGFIE